MKMERIPVKGISSIIIVGAQANVKVTNLSSHEITAKLNCDIPELKLSLFKSNNTTLEIKVDGNVRNISSDLILEVNIPFRIDDLWISSFETIVVDSHVYTKYLFIDASKGKEISSNAAFNEGNFKVGKSLKLSLKAIQNVTIDVTSQGGNIDLRLISINSIILTGSGSHTHITNKLHSEQNGYVATIKYLLGNRAYMTIS